jgi:protein-glutamine gamma-glutamyltransferase
MKPWRRANLVLPNRSAIGLGALLLAMWYAGASQNNGAAYLLCFVIASLSLLSLPHTWANLRGVTLRTGPMRPVFAGDQLIVNLVAESHSKRRHFGIRAKLRGAETAVLFPVLSMDQAARGEALVPAPTRGIHEQIEVQLRSTFPLGFCTARRWVALRQTYVVYPKPAGGLPLPITFDPARETPHGSRSEGDDYAGVRTWIPGESMRHIDWKAVSRGLPLMTKQWTSEAGHRLVLDWRSLPHADVEAKLSQLARWIVDAESHGCSYGLKLPEARIAPGQGDAHFHRCLRALAAFQPGSAEVPSQDSH